MERDLTILLLRLAFLAALYLFLALVWLMLWRDMGARRTESQGRSVGASLVVIDAGASGRGLGETLPLQPITTIGRQASNTLIFADESVSAEHALMSHRQGQWWLEDLASTNGTYLNTLPIGRPTIVRPGDVIRLGVVSLRLTA